MFLNINPKYRKQIIRSLSRTSHVFDGPEFIKSGIMGRNFNKSLIEDAPDLIALDYSKTTTYTDEASGFASGHGGISLEEMSTFFGSCRLSDFRPELKF